MKGEADVMKNYIFTLGITLVCFGIAKLIVAGLIKKYN